MDQPLSGGYRYGFDRDRKLREVTLPSGRTITNRYTADRLDATDTAEGTIAYSRDCGGRLLGASRAGEGVSYGYDGSAVTSDIRTGSIGATVGYTYNSDFLTASMTYAGATVSLTYDNDGLLTNAGGYAVSRNTLNGLPESVSDGAMSLTRTINGYGELDGAATSVNGALSYGWEVSRDAAGRAIQRREVIDGEAFTWDYAYDGAGRIVEVRRGAVVVESYAYDVNGNRLSAMSALRGPARRTPTPPKTTFSPPAPMSTASTWTGIWRKVRPPRGRRRTPTPPSGN